MSLTLKDLTAQIANKLICRQLNLSFRPGEIWGILGPNGIGKTTLLHTLTGLKKPKNGYILLNNKDILSTLSRKQIASRIGFLLQDNDYIFPSTVLDVTSSGHYANPKGGNNIADALTTTDLTHKRQQSILTLSGGEKRRAAIATLLAQNPDIYCLDEPSNHLDLKHQQRLLKHFQSLAAKGKTIILSTHDINLASRYCDKILLLYGNGVAIAGDCGTCLNQENLQRLYQCKFTEVTHQQHAYWLTDAVL